MFLLGVVLAVRHKFDNETFVSTPAALFQLALSIFCKVLPSECHLFQLLPVSGRSSPGQLSAFGGMPKILVDFLQEVFSESSPPAFYTPRFNRTITATEFGYVGTLYCL